MTADQKRNVVLTCALGVVLLICGGLIGYIAGHSGNSDQQALVSNSQPKDNIQRILDNMKEGDEVVVDLNEIKTPEQRTVTGAIGAGVKMKSERAYFRGMSWFGLGGPEAAAKDQGFSNITAGGTSVGASGQQKGYGILEQLWNWIKSVFWAVTFGAIILGILAFVPATAPFARAVWRAIGSIFPIFGSVTEWAIGNKKQQKFEQVVDGGEKFKQDLATSDLSDADKDKVKEIFKNAQAGKQDVKIQKEIKTVTA